MIRYALLSVLLFMGVSFSSESSAQLIQSLSVSPNPVHVPAGGAASTTFTWKVKNGVWSFFTYACIYVGVDSNEAAGPIDCEHPGNTYHSSINWVTYPHTYVVMIVPSNGTTHISGLFPPSYSNGTETGLQQTPFTAVSP